MKTKKERPQYKRKIGSPHLITGKEFKKFYNLKKKNHPEKSRITDRTEMMQVCSYIWEVVQQELIDNEGGVVLDKFGYLAHWMSPRKKVFKSYREGETSTLLNYFTNHYFYYTLLITNIFKLDFFKGWELEGAENHMIKKKRFEKLKSGVKYKFYLTMVRRLYSQRFNKED